MEQEEKFKMYDHIIYITTVNLYTLNKNNFYINLINYRDDDIEHRFILACATIIQNVALRNRIAMNLNWFQRCKISWRIRKKTKFIKKCKRDDCTQTVQQIIEFMRPAIKQITKDEHFNLGEIVRAYNMDKFKEEK